jgi:phosphonate degradation associated HDIG domain protein
MLNLADIERLFVEHGHAQYSGEPVSQLEHALQAAYFAEREGADDALITAALLHDLGHLLHDFGETPSLRGVDDLHQYRALPFLRGLFADDVLDAIKLHVDAKRYLCAVRPEYHATLSDDSKRSLVLQGGIFSDSEGVDFIGLPGAERAVRVRLWDDAAKITQLATPTLQHFMQCASRCATTAYT